MIQLLYIKKEKRQGTPCHLVTCKNKKNREENPVSVFFRAEDMALDNTKTSYHRLITIKSMTLFHIELASSGRCAPAVVQVKCERQKFLF